MPVERKVMVGWLATSKKFSERRSLSRISLPVSTDARSMVAVADDSSGISAVTISASNLLKCPRTLLTSCAGPRTLYASGWDRGPRCQLRSQGSRQLLRSSCLHGCEGVWTYVLVTRFLSV